MSYADLSINLSKQLNSSVPNNVPNNVHGRNDVNMNNIVKYSDLVVPYNTKVDYSVVKKLMLKIFTKLRKI